MAVIQHFERVEQLLQEHVLAPTVIGLRGEHGDAVLGQLVAAERSLAAPDREQHIGRHPEFLLDRGKGASVLGGQPLRPPGEPRNIGLLDVVGRGLDEFGLSARRHTFPAGQIEIGKSEIRLDSARCSVEGPARDPHALRLRPSPSSHFWNVGSAANAPVAVQAAIKVPEQAAANPRKSPISDDPLRSLCNNSPQPSVDDRRKKRRRYGVVDAASAARNRFSQHRKL